MAEFHVTLDGTGNQVSKHVEDEDPYEFVAVRFPSPPGHDADLIMAQTFVEEFALMGYDRASVRELFDTPFYAAPHGVLQRRGAEFVEEVLTGVFGPQDHKVGG